MIQLIQKFVKYLYITVLVVKEGIALRLKFLSFNAFFLQWNTVKMFLIFKKQSLTHFLAFSYFDRLIINLIILILTTTETKII